jgi:DNA mismatch repair protein MutH
LRTEAELLGRARALGGLTLPELARSVGRTLPDLTRHKGAIGELLEVALGITAGSRKGPDVPELGLELKTLPVDLDGRPVESTFVCVAPSEPELAWEGSCVRQKLARVLWVPIQSGADPNSRRVGSAFLWSPDAEADSMLRTDWSDLSERLWIDPERISASHGRALQLRPKGKNAASRRRSFDVEGAPSYAMSRAFYLRRTFTEGVLQREFPRDSHSADPG